MIINIGTIAYFFACAGFSFLTLLLMVSRRNQALSGHLVTAAAVTALWAATLAVDSTSIEVPQTLLQLMELLRTSSWSFFLISVIAQSGESDNKSFR